jgi:hypothetical protein
MSRDAVAGNRAVARGADDGTRARRGNIERQIPTVVSRCAPALFERRAPPHGALFARVRGA